MLIDLFCSSSTPYGLAFLHLYYEHSTIPPILPSGLFFNGDAEIVINLYYNQSYRLLPSITGHSPQLRPPSRPVPRFSSRFDPLLQMQ